MNKWDIRFLELASLIGTWSKDPRTKVGCVITGPDREIRTTGYNGLPRGAKDDLPERNERPEKLLWYEHAERNAIFNAARTGIRLENCSAYSTLCPCMDCARALIQSGIKRVITPKPDLVKYSIWADNFKKSELLFNECKVELTYLD